MKYLFAVLLLAGCGGDHYHLLDLTGTWDTRAHDYVLDEYVDEVWTFRGSTVEIDVNGAHETHQYKFENRQLVIDGQEVKIEEVTASAFAYLSGLNRRYSGRVVFFRRIP